jgi:polyhydroxyalkanoate synthase
MPQYRKTRQAETPPHPLPQIQGAGVRPRPLPLHLAAAMMNSTGALAALPSVRAGLLPWTPKLAAAASELVADMQGVDLPVLQAAVVAEASTRMTAMFDGITAYQNAPRPAERHEAGELVWTGGSSRLFDYGGGGVPALFVPSLINRAQILDLADDCSLMLWARAHGIRPLLLDWGAPGPDEAAFDVTDYVCRRLDGAFVAALERAGGPLGLVGYCLGGNLALALAQRRQRDIFGLALLATPWDFHAEHESQGRMILASAPALEAVLNAFGSLPVDLLQALFAALDPNLVERKFRRFAAMAPDSDEAKRFIQLEDWLNDGVPLVAGVAREVLFGWYGDNTPGRGEWRVGGEPVRSDALAKPVLLAIPETDRIVPAASARALVRCLPDASVITPPSGHIGMMVGGQCEAGLWRPLVEWLRAQAA